MSAWIVYSKDGTTERCRLKKLEYSGSFMNERTVTATFECESEVAFDVFDYIEYRGEKFELEAIPSVKKTSSHNYEYELRFVSLKYELERCEMRDIVPNDNGIVYPTPLTFSFTGDVAYLAERIQANLDALYGKGVWSIVVAEGVTSEDKNITISQQNCWNALSLVNTTYELDFTVKGRVVTIGGNKPSISHIFQYGKGKGLYEIERSADTETGIVTKLRAYGGTKNLDYSYPKKPEWSDSILDTSFVLSPLRLMLPSFKKDGKTDYIMADDSLVAKYGIREASVIYEDIYPSITSATNCKGEAIDEIKAVDDIDDSKSTFVIHLHELGFDLEDNLTTANAQVSMKTGAMQGYTFNIADNGIERLDDGSYKLTLGRITASSSDTDNFDIPNSKWNMKAGDKFVFLNILMPQEYIRSAENRLLERAKEYLSEYAKTNFSYNVGLHDKFLKQNQSVYNELIEGSKLRVYDEELGISEDVTIQSISITENMEDNILPQVKITLNNKPSASTLDRIQGQIKELSETTSGTFSSQSELLKQYRKKLDKPFFDRLFVAVGLDGKELASTDTNSPIAYIKAKYSFATIGGITMYAQDGNVDIPTIAEGLPFDNRTIWFNPTTKQIEVIGGTGGGTGGGSGEGVSNFWDLSGIPSWITNTKPTYKYSEIKNTPDLSKYALASQIPSLDGYAKLTDIPSLSGYATEQWVLGKGYALSSDLSKYIPISGTTKITGEKDFTGGLKVNGSPIVYDSRGFWKLEGNLIVTGGVSMFASDTKFTPSTIMDAIAVDGVTIIKQDGKLVALGGGGTGGGGIADSVAWGNVLGKPSWITEPAPIIGISGVNVSLGSGISQSSLRTALGLGSLAYKSSLGKADVGLGNVENTALSTWTGSNKIKTLGTITTGVWNGTKIANAYLANSAITISGTSVSLGGSITQSALRTALGLGSNAYSSTSYLPLTGGALTGKLSLQYANPRIILKDAEGTTLGAFGLNNDVLSYYKTADDKWYTIYHSGNFTPSNYLPLTGGTLSGKLILDNNIALCGKATDGTAMSVLQTTTNNNLSIGLDTSAKGYSTYISGFNIYLRYGTSRTTGLILNSSGNITIGSSDLASTNYKLYVNGMSYFNSQMNVVGNLYKYNAAKTYRLSLVNDSDYCSIYNIKADGSAYGNLVLQGNVGIGTTSPSSKLHVNGNFRVQRTNDTAAYLEIESQDITVKYLGYDSDGYINHIFYSNGTELMRLAGNTKVMTVQGNIVATGGVTMYSARKLKDIQDERGLSLEELRTIKPTRFTWKDGRDNKVHIGGIADDVQRVLPEVIYKTGEDDTLTMDYGNAAFAIAASLIKPVVSHEQRIKVLEEENERLKREIEQLKWHIA